MSSEKSKTVELRTGIIPAARYADKLRRVAIAAFKDVAPIDVIIRDVSELNKRLFKIIAEERKYEKTDFIRIIISATYDDINKRLIFGEPTIERLIPESKLQQVYEDKMKNLINEYERKMKELEEKLRKEYEERVSKEASRIKSQYEQRINELNKIIENYKNRVEKLEKEVSHLQSIIKQIHEMTSTILSR